MSIVTMGFFLGLPIGPLIAGILPSYSLALPVYTGALMLIPGAFIVYRCRPDSPSNSG
ncbi:MAG: hypothetical protein R6U51_02065 [Anaerolineales bacterium]